MDSPETAAPVTQDVGNPWRTRMILLSAAHAVGTACYMSIMAMGPIIRHDLGITAAQFGFFMSAVFSAQFMSALPSGVITDRLGVGWTLFGALSMSVLGTVLFSVADTFSLALVAAFLIGFGYSFVNPATARGVVHWFPAKWRATAMGMKQLGVPIGGVMAAGAGALAAFMDWRVVLWIAAGIAFATALAWLPLTRPPRRGAGGMRGIVADMRAVVTNWNMNVVGASCLLLNTGQSSLFSYMALFLRDAAQASQPLAALGVAVAQGTCAFGRVGYTYVSDAYFGGRRKTVLLILIGGAVLACGLAYFVDPSWPAWGLILVAVALGGTVPAYAGLMQAMAAESVPPHLVGSAIGYNAVSWSLGGMIGAPLFGLILDKSGGDYGLAWLGVGAAMLAGGWVVAAAYRERRRGE